MGETFSGPVTPAPLRTMAWGMLLVVLDLRIGSVDLLPDPIGWAVVLAAVLRLAPAHRAFTVTAWAAGAALLLSLPDWVGAGGEPVAVATAVVETVVVFATCTGVMALAPRHRRGADAVRWWDLGLTAALTLLGWLAATVDPDLAPAAILAVVAELVVLACFLVLLFRAAGDGPTAPGKTLQKTP